MGSGSLSYLIKKAEQRGAEQQEKSEKENIEKLKEYKKLLDDGIITQEDFDKKKQQLLGL